MKNKYLIISVALLAAVAVFYKMCSPAPVKNLVVAVGAGRSPTAATVTFGVTGDGCVGKGICNASIVGTQPPGDSATVVTFFGPSPESPNSILMTFDIRQLRQHQPGQVSNFNAGGSYIFQMPFSISQSNQLFAMWHLPAGNIISSTSQSFLSIVADTLLVDSIVYSVSQPAGGFVTFGDTLPGTTNPNLSVSGIYSLATVGSGSTVPVTISLSPVNASQIVLTYNFNALPVVQRPFYPQPGSCPAAGCNGNYMIIGDYVFGNSLPSSLCLPQGAMIMPNTPGRCHIGSDGRITDTISYIVPKSAGAGGVVPQPTPGP